MAARPLQPCRSPGCRELTRSTRCARHTREAKAGSTKNRPGDGFYSRQAWRRVRRRVLDREPLCEDCLALGRYTVSEQVDHVLDRRDRPDLELDESNLRALCASCHSRKTARTTASRRRARPEA